MGEQSVSFWFYAEKPPEGVTISALVAKGNAVSGHGGFRFFIAENGELVFRVGMTHPGTGLRYKAAQHKRVSWNAWHHVVGVIDRPSASDAREQVRLYVDQEMGAAGGGGASTDVLQSGTSIHTPQPLRIAWTRNPEDDSRQFFWGRLDDLQIYPHVVTVREIAALNAARPEFRETLVFEKTAEFCYRLPAIIRRPDGQLYAFAERRHTTEARDRTLCPDDGNVDIVVRRSANNGDTWGPEWLVFDHQTWPVSGATELVAGHNPTPVVDANGDTWLYYIVSAGADNSQDAVTDGRARLFAFRQFLSFKTAPKVSGPLQDITALLADEGTSKWFGFGPGHGIRMQGGACSGRVVVPVFVNHGNRESHSSVLIEDAPGACGAPGAVTLFRGGTTERSALGMSRSEGQVAEVGDGRLVFNARRTDTSATALRRVAFSTDGGLSWLPSSEDPVLADPVIHGSVSDFQSEGQRYVLFANAACQGPGGKSPFTLRRNMAVRVSTDGKNWTSVRSIRAGSSGYPDLVPLANDWVGLLYEAPMGGGLGAVIDDRLDPAYYHQGITFARFSFRWLLDDTSDDFEECDESILSR